MTTPESKIIQLGDRQDRVVATRQLLAEDVTEKQIRRLVRRGLLVPVRRGVYGVGRAPSSLRSRTRAVQLTLPGSAAYRRTAATLRGLDVGRSNRRVEVVVPRGRANQFGPGVTVHETLHLPSEDLTTIDGLAATTLERTLIDLATVCRAGDLIDAIQQMIVNRTVDEGRMVACFLAFARRGRAGTHRMRQILDAVLREGRAVPTSFLERAFAELCIVHDVVGLVPQYQPPWYEGDEGIVDFGSTAARLIVENDGRAWHTTSRRIDNDRRRDRKAARHGFLVLRYGYSEVVHRPAAVAAEVRFHLERRLADPQSAA